MSDKKQPLNEPGIVFDETIDVPAKQEESKVDVSYEISFDTSSVKKEKKNLAQNTQQDTQENNKAAETETRYLENEEVEFVIDPEEETGSLPKVSPETNPPTGTELQDKKVQGRIGDRLMEMGLITQDQLDVALHEKRITGKMLGEILVDLGFIDSQTLSSFLAQSAGYGIFDPKATIIDGEALSLIEKKMASTHLILPFSMTKDTVSVAMADPYDVVALDVLKQHIPKGLKVLPFVATHHVLSESIDTAYGYASSIKAILKELEGDERDHAEEIIKLSEDEAYSHPIVRLVNALIFEAVKVGASDLHFEPEENFVRLRYRVDGVLYTAQILHRQHWNGVSQRIKIMAQLNIADKLAPQDGRIQMNVAGREVDFRVSSLPTVFGENIVMRVLDKQSSIMSLTELGFSPGNLKRIEQAQKRPEGIIIVTGPTGSGKTTSLYSMLDEINTVDVNIQTLEDPVEYSLPMIRQTAVREGILDFADGVRAILRQDPDIVFIGEIRDKTTAAMALQAAMTGHQVYTTLHTNDSFGALPRLFDLGMVPGMLAGNIISVFAQRLTRTLCENCKEPYKPSPQELALFEGAEVVEIYKARQGGCDACQGQGYKGRTAIVEVLLFDEEMDEIIAKGGSKAELKSLAVAKGFKSLKDDAILKVINGVTSLDAVAKVVDLTK